MLARARLAATPSSSSPIRKRKTTVAASSAAPMKTAPIAATVISVSIENGVPAIAALIARRAIGTNPTIIASRKAHCSTAGMPLPSTNATASAAPDEMVSLALLVSHHRLARRSMIVEVGMPGLSFRSQLFAGMVVPGLFVLHLIRADDP